jgi:hypothetical protein
MTHFNPGDDETEPAYTVACPTCHQRSRAACFDQRYRGTKHRLIPHPARVAAASKETPVTSNADPEYGYSAEFTNPAGSKAAYAKVRGDVLWEYGHNRDAKGLRLAPGMIGLELMMGGRWVRWTTSKPDGDDRIRSAAKNATNDVFRWRMQ